MSANLSAIVTGLVAIVAGSVGAGLNHVFAQRVSKQKSHSEYRVELRAAYARLIGVEARYYGIACEYLGLIVRLDQIRAEVQGATNEELEGRITGELAGFVQAGSAAQAAAYEVLLLEPNERFRELVQPLVNELGIEEQGGATAALKDAEQRWRRVQALSDALGVRLAGPRALKGAAVDLIGDGTK